MGEISDKPLSENQGMIMLDLNFAFQPIESLVPIEPLRLAAAKKLQLDQLLDEGSRYLQGESAEYAQSFDRAVPKVEMPEKSKQANVGLFVLELTEENSNHAASSASVAYHSARAAMGAPVTTTFVNRYVYMKSKERPNFVGERDDGAQGYDNLVANEEKAAYANYNYVVISNSTGALENDLNSAQDRQKAEEKLDNFHGNDGKSEVIYVTASGNLGNQFGPRLHSSVRMHENNLLVGAADEKERTDPFGQTIRVVELEGYSNHQPSVVDFISPEGTEKYVDGDGNSRRFDGTSSATPRTAGGTVYPLLSKYGKTSENTENVLSGQDVLMAVRETARPVVTVGADIIEDTVIAQPILQTPQLMAGRYQTEAAGSGLVQVDAADELLQRRADYARQHPESVKPLVDRTVKLTPESQVQVDGMYEYRIQVNDDMLANLVTFDLQAKDKPGIGDKMTLTSPDGNIVILHAVNDYQEADDRYMTARQDAFLQTPTQGTWVIRTEKPLESIQMNLEQSIPRGHYAEIVRPDFTQQNRDLFKNTDLSFASKQELDALPLTESNLSQTILPSAYMERRLLAAVEQGNMKEAEALMATGYYPFDNQKEALKEQIKNKDISGMLKTLEAANGELSMLQDAIKNKDEAFLTRYLENGGSNLSDANKQTALMVLIDAKDLPNQDTFIRMAIENGADVNAVGADGRTALMRAADKLDTEEGKALFGQLLEKGANPEIQDREGRTVLFALKDHPDLIEKIAKQSPKALDVADNNGMTPAFEYIQSSPRAFMKAAEMGADLSVKTKEGKTLKDYDVVDMLPLVQDTQKEPEVQKEQKEQKNEDVPAPNMPTKDMPTMSLNTTAHEEVLAIAARMRQANNETKNEAMPAKPISRESTRYV